MGNVDGNGNGNGLDYISESDSGNCYGNGSIGGKGNGNGDW